MAHPYLTLGVLAFIGFLDSLYFSLVGLGWMRPDARFVPRVCRMDRGTCIQILDTRWARVFGVPNSHLGLLWYALLMGAAGWAVATGELPACVLLLAGSMGVLGVSVLLAWALLRRLRVVCTLCFLAHAVNLTVAALLLAVC